MTFLVAGYETTATPMIQAIHSLSQPENRHPIRPLCRNTSRILLQPASDHHIRPDLQPKLSLTRHVGGVLRLYSPAGVIPLVAAEDATKHSFRRTHPPWSPRFLFNKAYSVSASPGPSLQSTITILLSQKKHNVSSSAKKILLPSEKTRSRKIIKNQVISLKIHQTLC